MAMDTRLDITCSLCAISLGSVRKRAKVCEKACDQCAIGLYALAKCAISVRKSVRNACEMRAIVRFDIVGACEKSPPSLEGGFRTPNVRPHRKKREALKLDYWRG